MNLIISAGLKLNQKEPRWISDSLDMAANAVLALPIVQLPLEVLDLQFKRGRRSDGLCCAQHSDTSFWWKDKKGVVPAKIATRKFLSTTAEAAHSA